MNITPVYKSVTAGTGPFAATPADPLAIPVFLPGPFILGLQVVSENVADVVMRIMQRPGQQLFPDPVGRVMDAARLLPAVGAGWYVPAGSSYMDLRIVVDGPPYEIVIELGNKHASTAANVWINILAAAKPPDALSWELLREMRQGLDRLPDTMRHIMGEVVSSALERQTIPGGH